MASTTVNSWWRLCVGSRHRATQGLRYCSKRTTHQVIAERPTYLQALKIPLPGTHLFGTGGPFPPFPLVSPNRVESSRFPIGETKQNSSHFRVKGLIGAPVTPFNRNEDLDLGRIPKYVEHFLEFGVPNAFVCGTTGEGNNMSVAERKQVAEAWMREGRGKLSSIIIHIGAGNVKDSAELAKHSGEIEADAISCIAPTFFKPEVVDEYVEYMRRVAAAAPNTPFLLYDFFNFTGIKLGVNEFFHKGRQVIPTLAGTKHTTPDFPSMHQCHMDHAEAGMQVIMGTDEFFLEGLSIGLPNTIMNSFMGKILNRVRDAFEAGHLERARNEQGHAVQVGNIRRRMKLGVPDGSKAILKAMGLDMGPCRCPISKLTAEGEAALMNDLNKIGFFNWGIK